MLNPYFLMTLLYAALAILAALDSALVSLNLLPWFNGLGWLRVHFITLGILTQVAFGVCAALVAARSEHAKPKTRWDIWLALNLGILTLMVGIPLLHAALIIVGGTFVLVAAALLLQQLFALRDKSVRAPSGFGGGRKFYLVGLIYLLLGIFVGTGLWQGWNQALQMRAPREVHIHANIWGFAMLVCAGLLVDLYPGFAARALAWPRSLTPIFWMFTLGALALILGPWFDNNAFTVPGIGLVVGGMIWLLLNVIKPLRHERAMWRTPGLWSLVTAYVWLLAPIFGAPFVLLYAVRLPDAGIVENVPQALVYGWILLFSSALAPYLFTRVFLPAEPAQLGGSWFGLGAVHLGGIFLWASLFIAEYQTALYGMAYLFWTASLIPFAMTLWRSVRAGTWRIETTDSLL